MSKNNKLPELSDENIGKLENQIFQQIGSERAQKKRRLTITTYSFAAVAALSLVAGVGVPLLLNTQNVTSEVADGASPPRNLDTDSGSSTDGYYQQTSGEAPSTGGTKTDGKASEFSPSSDKTPEISLLNADTEISRNANVVVEVTNLNKAISDTRDQVQKLLGRISHLSYATDGSNPAAGNEGGGSTDDYIVPPDFGYYPSPDYGYADKNSAYLSIKIPYTSLDQYLDGLDKIGTIVSLNVSEQDRSGEFTTLRKSKETTEKVLARLRDLLPKASTLSETLELEREIAYRETELQWIEEQLDNVSEQVLMSNVIIELRQLDTTKANPNGFLDGIAKGWDSLVNGFNWMLIALGWILPWAALLAAIWLLAALTRRGRGQKREQ